MEPERDFLINPTEIDIWNESSLIGIRTDGIPIPISARGIRRNVCCSIFVIQLALLITSIVYILEMARSLSNGFAYFVLLFLIASTTLFVLLDMTFLGLSRYCLESRLERIVFGFHALVFLNSIIFTVILWYCLITRIIRTNETWGSAKAPEGSDIQSESINEFIEVLNLIFCSFVVLLIYPIFGSTSPSKLRNDELLVVLSRRHTYSVVFSLIINESLGGILGLYTITVNIIQRVFGGFYWPVLVVILSFTNSFVILSLFCCWRSGILRKWYIFIIKFAFCNSVLQILFALGFGIFRIFYVLKSLVKDDKTETFGSTISLTISIVWFLASIAGLFLYNFVDYELLQRQFYSEKDIRRRKTPLFMSCCNFGL